MKIHDQPGLELIAEFEEVELNIKVLDRSFVNYDFVEYFGEKHTDDPDSFYQEWCFEVKFNNDFVVHCLDYGKTRIEYKDFILKKVNAFQREIGDVIESDKIYEEKLIILDDYRIKFQLLSKLYTEEEYQYCNLKFDLLAHTNTRVNKESDKRTSEHNLKHIIHSFLTIQKRAIENILFYLDAKMELLREIGVYEAAEKKANKKMKRADPIKILNRYQSVLLFNYLQEAGAINSFSANALAPLISQLTGHSENTIRTEALSNIIDVKKGIVGDQNQVRKDPDINLREVKKTIKSILISIDEDLEKNQKLRENGKL